MTEPNLTAFWDIAKGSLPLRAATRIFDPTPSDHPSWKAVMAGSVLSLLNRASIEGEGRKVPDTTRSEALLSMQAAKHDFPLVWVDRSLLECILRSDPPEDFCVTDLKWPFPALTFILPKGTLSHADDGDCSWLMIGKEEGDITCPLTGDMVRMNKPVVFAMTAPWNTPNPPTFNFGIPLESGFMPFKPLPDLGPGTVDDFSGGTPFARGGLSADDKTFTELVMQLGLRLVLTLTAKPDLLSAASPGTIVRSKGAAREFCSPRWLGKGHSISVQSSEGDGGNVRLHWRRGHFKNQPHGEGRVLRKVIWIQPYLAGSPP